MGFGQIKPHFLFVDIFWFLKNSPTFTFGIIEVAFCLPTCFDKKSSLGIFFFFFYFQFWNKFYTSCKLVDHRCQFKIFLKYFFKFILLVVQNKNCNFKHNVFQIYEICNNNIV